MIESKLGMVKVCLLNLMVPHGLCLRPHLILNLFLSIFYICLIFLETCYLCPNLQRIDVPCLNFPLTNALWNLRLLIKLFLKGILLRMICIFFLTIVCFRHKLMVLFSFPQIMVYIVIDQLFKDVLQIVVSLVIRKLYLIIILMMIFPYIIIE